MELITHYRIFSLNVVESITKWRDWLEVQLQNASDKQRQALYVPYLYNEQNYLLKVERNTLTPIFLLRFFF